MHLLKITFLLKNIAKIAQEIEVSSEKKAFLQMPFALVFYHLMQ